LSAGVLTKELITIAHVHQDQWVNPFGATPPELVAAALEESGLLDQYTVINNKNAREFFQAYCQKRNLFQEATKLGNILVKEGVLTTEQLNHALQTQAENPKPLGEVLTELALCSAQDIERALERQKSIREDLYKLEQARETRRTVWHRIIRFFFDDSEKQA